MSVTIQTKTCLKTIPCRETGIDCNHVAAGYTKNEVIQNAIWHMEENHSDFFDRIKKYMTPPEIKSSFSWQIK